MASLRFTEQQVAALQRKGDTPAARKQRGRKWAVQLALDIGPAPKRYNICAEEWREAEALMDWVRAIGIARYPELQWLAHIPNGGWRNKAVAAKLKRQGVKPGVYDFRLPVARYGYHGLDLELKRRVGGTVSPEQKQWGEGLLANGYLAVVCRGWESARDALVDYLAPNG